MVSDLVDRHDVRVIQRRRGFRFDPEPLDVALRGKLARSDHFERHRAVQARLTCPVDHPHAAAANFLKKLVVPEVTDLRE